MPDIVAEQSTDDDITGELREIREMNNTAAFQYESATGRLQVDRIRRLESNLRGSGF